MQLALPYPNEFNPLKYSAMARSDLILSLIRAGTKGDQNLFRKTVEAIIAEERAKQHHVLAEQLTDALKSNGIAAAPELTVQSSPVTDLFYEVSPRRKLDELVLPVLVRSICREIVEEQHRQELLSSHGLAPRNRILLVGPPGNGKTSLAEAIAEAMMVPLISARYDGLIGSYLGETASRLRKLFDYTRSRRCVLFFDEFDTLGKERGDAHDTGEIKRVVSSLLLQIDSLPSYVVVITATNHPELLDRAVWRRFQARLRLPSPSKRDIEDWFRHAEKRIGKSFGYSPRALANKLQVSSYSELEDFCGDVLRRLILAGADSNMKSIVSQRLEQWHERRGSARQMRPNE